METREDGKNVSDALQLKTPSQLPSREPLSYTSPSLHINLKFEISTFFVSYSSRDLPFTATTVPIK